MQVETTPTLNISALTKTYSSFQALNNTTLTLDLSGIIGLLGCNGAGKSTLIRILLGITHPDSGTATVCGLDALSPAEALEIRKSVAYVAEEKALYKDFTVGQMTAFMRNMYSDWSDSRADKLLRTWDIPRNKRVAALSRGTRTKLALILGLARSARLIILDEPTEGLDPVAIEQLLAMIENARDNGSCVLFSCHHLAEVQRIADRVVVLHQGTIRGNREVSEFPNPNDLHKYFLGVISAC